MSNQPIILFDGVCNFCNDVVTFTIKRDKKGIIKFAPLQGSTGIKLKKKYGIDAADMTSFLFIENGKCYDRSTAALKVCRHLKGLWRLCYGFIIIPAFIRDALYNFIAKNRYNWFGKRESCMVPTAELRERFL